ncbi:unnamed protein product [Leptosia nina]|uniref:HAUS augmin-like complex subunit 3 N-terminal domain-containing protein n=1 Tax=Leptosia nina TaxID=320188 RepID=A0AAV1JQ29_9NEOP
MNQFYDISDEDFVPFLKGLGVETYNKSFEWILNDPDFSGVLRWIYENIDGNNALSDREECRYAELERTGGLLPPGELEAALNELQDEFKDICLPGDQEALEDVKMDIKMDKERLSMLKRQEIMLEEMMENNITIKKELNIEITNLKAAEQQYTEEVSTLGKDCLRMSMEVESITNNIMGIIAETLETFYNCQQDKDTANKFLAFGPFEQYNQSQSLFRSHFDLYCSKKLKNTEGMIKDEEILKTIIKAKNLEERLSTAILACVDSTATLCGERAKLDLVTNYNQVNYNDSDIFVMEIKNNIEMLEQEETLIEQQLLHEGKQLVQRRTQVVEEVAAKTALEVRLQIQNNLKWLWSKTQETLALDRLLYYGLRRELASIEEILQFASHLRSCVMQEGDAVFSRIQSMKSICYEQAQAEARFQDNDRLLSFLYTIFGKKLEAKSLVGLYKDVKNQIKILRNDVIGVINEKEMDLNKFEKSQASLRAAIWDGCTRAANCYSPEVSSMSHALLHEIEAVDAVVKSTTAQFASVKNGDKQNLRKLWQWFLTDQNKLLALIQNVY